MTYPLEMDAAFWAMKHFSTFLVGKHFVLFTDHKTLKTMGKVHTKTHNRLQLATFDFKIVYKKGSEMPADYLSRSFVKAITLDDMAIKAEQEKEPDYKALKAFLLNDTTHPSSGKAQALQTLAANCFVQDSILWRRFKRPNKPSRVLLMLHHSMRKDTIQEAHGTPLSGMIASTRPRNGSCNHTGG